MNREKLRRRRLGIAALGVSLLLGCLIGKPTFLVLNAWMHDRPTKDVLPPHHVDDASRQNRTEVAEIWAVPADPLAAETQLQALLERARAEKKPVAIGGARHSMGGHTIAPGGIVLDMLPFKRMELDAERGLLTVGAGARWSEVIPYLDARGFSIGVMQSNNDFSVGGSLSVNCHGWQHNRPPIASTVHAFRLMKADGTIVRCTRQENAELFGLALGGYGLFGIILDAELRVVPNERYRSEVTALASEQYPLRFDEKVTRTQDAGMVYGRLCVVPGDKTFLREAVLTVFRKAPCPDKDCPTLKAPSYEKLRREIYRAQIGSQAGKELRWKAERLVGEQASSKFFSRNQLLNEGAEVYREGNLDRTDILHEYFIPPDQVAAFLEKARAILPKHPADLMNVTVRNVLEDHDTVLLYADRELFAFVMLFNQPRTPEADLAMEKLTQELIDASLECAGRYYLPYRPHATRAQFLRAYPQALRFFEAQRRYDPEGVFQNLFSARYGRP